MTTTSGYSGVGQEVFLLRHFIINSTHEHSAQCWCNVVAVIKKNLLLVEVKLALSCKVQFGSREDRRSADICSAGHNAQKPRYIGHRYPQGTCIPVLHTPHNAAILANVAKICQLLTRGRLKLKETLRCRARTRRNWPTSHNNTTTRWAPRASVLQIVSPLNQD